jgi:hypothetical protein
MTIDKSATAVTENLIDEQLYTNDLTSQDSFIKSCEKRETPMLIDLEDLFYDEDEDDEGFGYFYPSNLRNYINELDLYDKLALKRIFTCINYNVRIIPETSEDNLEKSILVTILNHYEGGKFVFRLPYCGWLNDFLWQYNMLEISCNVTFEHITKYLEI